MYPESMRCLTVSELTSSKLISEMKNNTTDFAILTGARCSNMEDYKNHKSAFYILSDDLSLPGIVTETGVISAESPSMSDIAIKPCLKYSDVKDQATLYKSRVGEIASVVYGQYPERIAGGIEAEVVSVLFNSGYYEKTGKTYSFYKDNIKKEYDEYFIGNEKYILYEFNDDRNIINNNGDKLETGKSYWIRVQNLRWVLDEEKDLLVCTDSLVSGINYGTISNSYEDSKLNYFIMNNLAKEIIPSKMEKEISK